jgi:TolB-like protein
MNKNNRILLCLFFLLIITAGFIFADTSPVKISFLAIENMSMDPRYDYLEGIIGGILLFDLAGAEDVVVVDRSSLESVLKEQELILSDLTNKDKAVSVGKLLGADYLLKGQYVFLGDEIMVTLALIDVESSETLSFSGRGSSENLIHSMAEQIIFRLTGSEVVLQSEQHERSILSLKDEKPGGIALHCNLVHAEIFLDNEFIGYTIGKATEPYEIENLIPGKHTLRVHLLGFGVVGQPEITFHDWQEVIDVKPGKRHVLQARIYHFAESLYELKQLLHRYESFNEPFNKQHELSFVDREGNKINLIVDVEFSFSGEQAVLNATVTYNGKPHLLKNKCGVDNKNEVSKTIDKIDVTLRISYRSKKRCDISYTVSRNDIYIDMWEK